MTSNMPPTPPGITHISRKTPDISHLPGPKYKKPVEGDLGTWSHCGKRTPHLEHFHSFAMNEGMYSNILCHGTEEPPRLDTNQRIGYADPMPVNIETTDQAKAIIATTLGIPLEYRDLNPDDLVSARDRAEALLQSVELLEKNPVLVVEVRIGGRTFNIVTEEFNSVGEAIDFFDSHTTAGTFLQEIRDENGNIL